MKFSKRLLCMVLFFLAGGNVHAECDQEGMGNKVGAALDCKDQQYHYDTTQSALESQKTGQASTWSNPDTGHSGTITPTKTYTSADGMPCRDFNQTIYVDGKYEEVKGSACRQPDGTWKPVS